MHELAGKRIYVAGHSGMVGGALMRRLAREDCALLTASHGELDLRDPARTLDFVGAARPDIIIIAAARVGGILANDTQPVDFLHDNLMIAANLFAAAHASDVPRVLFLGSSCIYPRDAAQPIAETALMSGPLEATNQWYALAKIAGIRLAQAYRRQYGRDYISAMPANLYGPGDTFDPVRAHVLPALIHKAHEARVRGLGAISVWGSGTPRREFLHVDDCAEALVVLLQRYSGAPPVNVGSGADLSIAELAQMVCRVVGYSGRMEFDVSRPDGTPRKLMANDRMSAFGWGPAIPLERGIAETYRWYCARIAGELAA